MSKFNSSLYFITDSTPYSEEEFLHRVEEALAGGATLLQLREKERTTREYLQLGAEGVHVGQSDLPVADARRLMGPDKIVGATTKTVPQALEAYEQGADYLGVGAIYPTTTKVKTILTSTDTLREICEAVPIAVNAIGGLNKDNIDVLEGIPIAGICVVSAIMKAADPRQAAQQLKARAMELKLCAKQ